MTNSTSQRTKEIEAYLEQSRINREASDREHKESMQRIYKELDRRSKEAKEAKEAKEVKDIKLINNGVIELFNTTFTTKEHALLDWALDSVKEELQRQLANNEDACLAKEDLQSLNLLAIKLGVQL